MTARAAAIRPLFLFPDSSFAEPSLKENERINVADWGGLAAGLATRAWISASVIVPWKSSGLGVSLDVSDSLDAGRRPVDREVFVRALDYYEVRSGKGK